MPLTSATAMQPWTPTRPGQFRLELQHLCLDRACHYRSFATGRALIWSVREATHVA
jgi:hypothetical protein